MTKGIESLWTIKDSKGIDGRTLDSERIATLEGLLQTTYGPHVSAPSLERLKSRKNIVLRLLLEHEGEARSVVAKLFIERSFEVEEEVLVLGRKESIAVPKMIAAREGVILMEHIDGLPLVDVLNESFDKGTVERLAAWYHAFHHATGHVKGDPRLKNFINKDEKIYGLDFEEYRRDHWMEDIGGVSASILDTRPVFDKRKVQLVWDLLEAYLSLSGRERTKGIDTHFIEVIARVLEQTARWREDEQLLAHAKRVRKQGLPID